LLNIVDPIIKTLEIKKVLAVLKIFYGNFKYVLTVEILIFEIIDNNQKISQNQI